MTLLTAISPILILIAAGYLAARTHLLDARDAERLSRFVVTLALPILLFNSLAHVELPDSINWAFLLSYYGVAFAIYAVGVLISAAGFRHGQKEQGIFGLGASYGNLMLVGYPIIYAGLGDEAVIPLVLIVSIHSALLLTIMTVLVERDGENTSASVIVGHTAKGFISNPVIIGLMLGLAVNLLGIPIPDLLQGPIDLLSRVTVPGALFVVGTSLHNQKVTGHLIESAAMVGLKMLAQPLLVWVLVFPLLHLDLLWGTVAVMTAGMPVGVNVNLFAQRYQTGVATVSAATVISTVFAMLSQPIMIALYLRSTGA